MIVSVTKQVDVQFFGDSTVSWQGETIRPASKKTFALMLYLAASGQPVGRDHLAELLWGSIDKRANVRQALYELRKEPGATDWLIDDGVNLEVLSAPTLTALFDELESGSISITEQYLPHLFCVGLEGVSPSFDDWLSEQRARLERSVKVALQHALREAERRSDHGAALQSITALLELTPYAEPLYRQAFRHIVQLGDADQLATLFHRAERLFADELDVELSPETVAKYETLRSSVTLVTRQLNQNELALAQLLYLAKGELSIEECAFALDISAFALAEMLDSLGERNILHDGFIVSEAVSEEFDRSLTWSRRSLLHERIVAALGEDVDPALRARHLLGCNKPEQAAPYLLEAARAAADAQQNERAIELLFQTLWASKTSRRVRTRALLLLEGIAGLRVDDSLQGIVLTEAEKLAWEEQDDEFLSQTLLRRARMLIRRRQFGEALKKALDALEIGLRVEDEQIIVQARNVIGGVHFYLGEIEGALAAFEQNLDAESPIDRYAALNNVAMISAHLGRRDESLAFLSEALTLARQTERQPDIISTLNNLAATAERFGHYERAASSIREALTLARKVGAEDLAGRLQLNLVVVYTRQGELGPAWNTLKEVEDDLIETGETNQIVRVLELLADLEQTTGSLQNAEQYLQKILTFDTDGTLDRNRSVIEAVLGLTQYRTGDIDVDAAIAAVTKLEEAQISDLPNWLWLELGWTERNHETAKRLLSYVDEAALNPHQAVLYVARHVTLVQSDDERAQWLERAQQLAIELKAPAQLSAQTPGPIVEWPLIAATLEYAKNGKFSESFVESFQAAISEQAQGLPKTVRERFIAFRMEELTHY